MCQGSRLNLEDFAGHLPGRDASLSRVYASDGIPCRPKHIAVVMILQSQLHKVNGRNASGSRSHNETIGVDSGRFGNESGPARNATLKHTFTNIKQEVRSNPPAHL